jgi:hypothetical protein
MSAAQARIGPLRRVDPTEYGGRDGSQPLALGESAVKLGTRTPPRLLGPVPGSHPEHHDRDLPQLVPMSFQEPVGVAVHRPE